MEKSVENLIEQLYKDTAIHFLMQPENKNVMVNATDMAKIYDKRVQKFRDLKTTQEFIDALLVSENEKLKIRNKDPEQGFYLTEIDVYDGRKRGGTFMHRKLAVKFAAWLDVRFEIWMIDVIDQILHQTIFKRLNVLESKTDKADERKRLLEKIEQSPDYLRIKQIEAENRKLDKALKKLDNDLLAGQIPMDL